MRRNRMIALLLAGCMVLGQSNVLLYAEESDEQIFTIEEDNESEIQEDVMAEQADEDEDLYASDLIEDEEEELYAAEIADTTPPEIDAATLQLTLPEGKDKVTAGDTIEISIKITDESDLSYASAYIINVESNQGKTVSLNKEEGDLWYKSYEITQQISSGDWQIVYVEARDTNNNYRAVQNSHFINKDGNMPYSNTVGAVDMSAANFTVEGTYADTTPPEIDATTLQLTLPEGKDKVTEGDTIEISIKITDESDLSYASAYIINVESNQGKTVSLNKEEGDLWYKSYEITQQISSGDWQIVYVEARDTNNNYRAVQNSHFINKDGNMPYSNTVGAVDMSAANFTVEGTHADTTPPEIDATTLQLTLPEGKDKVTEGDTIEISIKVTDESDLSYVQAYLMNAESNQGKTVSLNKEEGDLWYKSYEITQQISSGDWQIVYVEARDTNNNYRAVQNSHFINKNGNMPYSNTVGAVDMSAANFTVAEMFSITFDSRGGSEVETQYVLPGETATRPEPQPTKEDYTFGGWYADEELTVPFDFDTAINENTIIYAKWNEIPVTMTVGVYDLTNSICGQGGTYTFNAEDMTHTADKHVVSKGNEVTLTAAPADGYKFVEWVEGEVIEGTEELQIRPGNEIADPEPTVTIHADQDIVLCAVFADENVLTGWCGDNVTYELNKKTGILTISGTGPMEDYNYSYNDPVSPFCGNPDIKKVIVEDGVTYIGKAAFWNCWTVTEVTLPDSVRGIGGAAFYACTELERITLPQDLTRIEPETFEYCYNLQEIDIPESVSVIGEGAFMECVKLSELTLPANVTSIEYAFSGCIGLTSITVDPGNTVFDSRNNCNAIIETNSDTLVLGCSSTVIPDTVMIIGSGAFSGAGEYPGYYWDMYGESLVDYGLEEIDIPANVKEIGTGAFICCFGLKQVTLHDGLQKIGDNAFLDCNALENIIIPDTVTELGQETFEFCLALQTVSLPAGITEIKNSTFYYCYALEEIVIPDGVIIINSGAFGGCYNLQKIILPDSLEKISRYNVFQSCSSLKEIDLPASLTELDPSTFNGSGIVAEGGVINYAGSLKQWNALTGGSDTLKPQSFGAYDVTFYPNGGSEVEPQIVSVGDKVQKPDDPAKGEDVFGGWFTDEALTKPFDFDSGINADVTLHAKWLSPDTDFDLSHCTVTFDENYRVLDDIESTPYDDWFYIVPSGTILEPLVKSGDETLTSNYYKASYSECMFYEERNEWDKIDDNVWIDHFPTDAGVYLCKVEGVDPYYGSYEWIDLIRILPGAIVCTNHDFGPNQTVKATTTSEGRVYHVCKICGTEETIKVLPKLKPAAPVEKITISKKPSIKKPAATKNKITVKWKHFKHTSKKTKKIWKKIKKVQVQCATDSGFKNIVKDVKIGRSKTKYAIKGLAKKTTYYVRVRYFDGVGYSNWSKVKKVKTKK